MQKEQETDSQTGWHYENEEFQLALQKSRESEALWKQIGCFPNSMKFYMFNVRALIYKGAGQFNDALEWARKAQQVAHAVDKGLQSGILMLVADLAQGCGRYQEAFDARRELLEGEVPMWN